MDDEDANDDRRYPSVLSSRVTPLATTGDQLLASLQYHRALVTGRARGIDLSNYECVECNLGGCTEAVKNPVHKSSCNFRIHQLYSNPTYIISNTFSFKSFDLFIPNIRLPTSFAQSTTQSRFEHAHAVG
jgi:hypothetical protein